MTTTAKHLLSEIVAGLDGVTLLGSLLDQPFCVVFLDGRNEHGSHVLPSFPKSFDDDADDIGSQAEAILVSAETEGFAVGDHVWAEFDHVPPQIDHEGRVELAGYWEFRGINKPMSLALRTKAQPHSETRQEQR